MTTHRLTHPSGLLLRGTVLGDVASGPDGLGRVPMVRFPDSVGLVPLVADDGWHVQEGGTESLVAARNGDALAVCPAEGADGHAVRVAETYLDRGLLWLDPEQAEHLAERLIIAAASARSLNASRLAELSS